MTKSVQTSIIAAIVIALANCAPPVETSPVTSQLEPAPAVAPQVGDTWIERVGERMETTRVTSVEGSLATAVNETTGCEYAFYTDGFGPAPTFSNCGGDTGTQTANRDGNIFPLTVGAKESWSVSGRNSKGDTWNTTRRCEVEGTAKVSVPLGSFDTYHIRCDDDWRTREWWYAPEINQTVMYRNINHGRNEVELRQLESFTSGAAS